MTPKWLVIVLLTLVLPVITFAQTTNDPGFWDSIEKSIRNKSRLGNNYKRLEDMKTAALQQKDHNI